MTVFPGAPGCSSKVAGPGVPEIERDRRQDNSDVPTATTTVPTKDDRTVSVKAR